MQIPINIFRRYDIRGAYGTEVDERIAYAVGFFIVPYLHLSKPRVFVSYDARKSSLSLTRALVAGLQKAGARVVCGGLSTTPMHMYLVAKHKFDLGIMVTASHNPPEFNGFKINLKGARPFFGDALQKFSEVIRDKTIGYPAEEVAELVIEERSYLDTYVEFLMEHLPPRIMRKRVVIDPSHGVAGMVLARIAEKKKLKNWIFVADEISGEFGAHGPNPLLRDSFLFLRNSLKKHKGDLGVIFDVDADRVFFLFPEEKEYFRSDIIGFLLSKTYLQKDPHAKILYDVRAGTFFRDELLKKGGCPILTQVGHPYFKEDMRRNKAWFGFELSGHYYFREFFNVDSGIFAFIKFLGLFLKAGEGFKKEKALFSQRVKSLEMNYVVADKDAILCDVEELYGEYGSVSHFDGLSIEAKEFYINMRASGTEDLVRLNVEAKNKKVLNEIVRSVEDVVQQNNG